MSFKLILILIIAGLAVIFITQNVAAVDVTFLFWSISLSRALLIFFVLVIGFVLGWFLHSYLAYKKRSKSYLTAPDLPGQGWIGGCFGIEPLRWMVINLLSPQTKATKNAITAYSTHLGGLSRP